MHNITRRFLTLLLLAGFVPLLGCGKAADMKSPVDASQHKSIGVSLASFDSPSQMQLKADIEAAAAKHPDFHLTVLSAQDDAAKQQSQLEEFRSSRASAVIVCPTNVQAITDPVAKLIDAGIPVIALDRALIGAKYSCLIAADAQQIGKAAGEWLARQPHGTEMIVELRGPVKSGWDDEVHGAWRAGLRDPGFRFVFSNHVDPPKLDAGKLMGEALKEIEEIDAVFAYDDAAADAAYQTAKAAGREKDTLFISVGGSPKQGAAYVEQGTVSAAITHPTGGEEAIDAAMKLCAGQSVPKKIVLPARVIDKDNVK